MTTLWPWLTLALLGAYHGLNPAMGWLFAVALGLQERRRAAVLRAFAPIALGHAASVVVVVALVGAASAFIAPTVVQGAGAVALVAFGLYKLLAPLAHPRWVGMRVGFRDLVVWSFLMSSAHGAGLMLVPVLLALPAPLGICTFGSLGGPPATHTGHALLVGAAPSASLAAVGLHTATMFAVMALVALVVYERLGLTILRRAWLNLDRVWAGGLLAAGLLALVSA